MSRANKIPTYNLKVVLQVTGIKPDTLRAWERRYGLPLPERTPGGHRLYSQYDIEMIRWLLERQEEGMRINRAVDLWRSMEADGKDPLDQVNPLQFEDGLERSAVITGSTLEETRRAWIAACMAFDEANAEHVLAQSFALYPIESVCLEVLQKGMHEIGELWYRGELTVQQEHFASALALRRLDALLAASPPPTRQDRILVGCPPGETHTFSPLLITLFLRQRGWNVIYLGADVPQANLASAMQMAGIKLVILTATQLTSAASLYQLAISEDYEHIPLGFGGPVFTRIPALRSRIPGHFLGERLDRAVQVVEQLIAFPPRTPRIEKADEHYQQLFVEFRSRERYIQAQVWDVIQDNGMDLHTLQIANEYLCKNISASLMLGSLDFLDSEVEWVRILIAHHQLPATLLPEYLGIFSAAVESQMPEMGGVIVDAIQKAKDKLS